MVDQLYSRRPLLPEIWLRKIIESWGVKIPIILFAPYGLRLNGTLTSNQWNRFTSGEYPQIPSIIALPKNIYPGITFHSKILIFNIRGLKPHYFYNETDNN